MPELATNKDALESVDRNFVVKLDASESNFKIDETTGFLTSRAYFTRTGVFKYKIDGVELQEYRSEEEVFNEESLKSLALKPITDLHPDKDTYPDRMVTVDNVKDLQVGMVGSEFQKEGDFIAGDVVITDKDMVETLVARRELGLTTELSGGYKCKVEFAKGVHTDGPYNCVQKKIRYNHVSIVPTGTGRAGREVRILDNDSKKREGRMPENLVKFSRKAINLDSFKVDAISVTLPEDAISVVESLSNKLDSAAEMIQTKDTIITELQSKVDVGLADAKKQNDALQAKFDQLEESSKQIKIDMDELSDPNSDRVKAMLELRQSVNDTATKLKVNTDSRDINTIKLDCIKAVSPDFDPKDRSVDYIEARYDSIVEGLKVAEKEDGNKALGAFVMAAHDSTNTGPKDYRQEFIDKSKEAGKK